MSRLDLSNIIPDLRTRLGLVYALREQEGAVRVSSNSELCFMTPRSVYF